ncbi:MAG: YdgA family protein [Betaproteobacteria bacterium]|nr:YdgA family protein [Betaproteobacteria bacterium]
MKKILWIPIAIVVLIVLWLGATWYTGKVIETRLGGTVASLNKTWSEDNSRYQPQIKSLSYERGLLSSHARYALTGSELSSDDAPQFDVTIWHGPFPRSLMPNQFALHAELVPTGTIKMVTGALMAGKSPLIVDASCSYGNHCSGVGNVPAIDYAVDKSFKLAFGGVQSQFDITANSSTDYKGATDIQFLPLSINGQNFGRGQWAITANPLGASHAISWKTDQGESKASLVFALSKPFTAADFEAAKPEEADNLITTLVKSAKVNVSLSRPMLVDIGTRAATLMNPNVDLASAQKEVNTQINAFLSSDPKAKQFLLVQGDAITSDLQYADGKLTLNGQENPELLAQLKQAIAMKMKGF